MLFLLRARCTRLEGLNCPTFCMHEPFVCICMHAAKAAHRGHAEHLVKHCRKSKSGPPLKSVLGDLEQIYLQLSFAFATKD
jgi:hypothetical protein